MKHVLMFVLMLFASAAHAGQYVVTYNGGACTQTINGAVVNTPFVLTGDGYSSPINAHSTQCSGPITATFTWQAVGANDLPPKTAIVRQTVIASGKSGASDGLGDPTKASGGNDTSQGTHYQIASDPSSSFTVQCNPKSTASVSYQAQAYSVTITLTGTLQDASGTDSILVGQNCGASLTVLNLPSDVTLGSPTWTIPGKAYTKFQISVDQSLGRAVSYDASAKNPSSWYWTDGDITGNIKTIKAAAVLKCADFTATVTAQKAVTVWSPTLYLSPPGVTNPALGVVGIQPDDQSGPGAVISNAPPSEAGFELEAGVGTPPQFADSGNNYGNWAWLQLCRLNVSQGGSGTQMGHYELDSAFPYNMSTTAADTPGVLWAAHSTAKKPYYQLFSDSPEEGWATNDRTLAFDNAYRLYAMFLPPGNGNGDPHWVPLASFGWGFHSHITRPNVVTSDWSPDPPGTITYSSSVQNPDYPTWTARFGSAN